VGFAGAGGTVSWMTRTGMRIARYTTVIMRVTAMGTKENGLCHFMVAVVAMSSIELAAWGS